MTVLQSTKQTMDYEEGVRPEARGPSILTGPENFGGRGDISRFEAARVMVWRVCFAGDRELRRSCKPGRPPVEPLKYLHSQGFGGVAQLGEHGVRNAGVRGSSPLTSIPLFCTVSPKTADPSNTGVFSCAAFTACGSLQPIACADCAGFCFAHAATGTSPAPGPASASAPPFTAASKCASVVIGAKALH